MSQFRLEMVLVGAYFGGPRRARALKLWRFYCDMPKVLVSRSGGGIADGNIFFRQRKDDRTCDVCLRYILCGDLYRKCQSCFDFDICLECFGLGARCPRTSTRWPFTNQMSFQMMNLRSDEIISEIILPFKLLRSQS